LSDSSSGGLNRTPNRRTLANVAFWAGLAIVTAAAIRRVGEFPYYTGAFDWRSVFAGVRPLLSETGWAAVRVALFWGWGTAVIAGVLLTIDPALGLCDAALAGASGLWAFAYLIGSVLGPLGLFRAPAIWAMLALGTLALFRRPPAWRFGRPSDGQKLALLAFGLLATITIPLQLGSPAVPFTDALAWPGAGQRIINFHLYSPFNNDPWGASGRFVQAPALELFWAMLALGTHSRFAVLAESAAIIPMAGLLVFSVYRLGRTLFGDVAGGMAALLFLATPFVRGEHSMGPKVVDYAMAGLGLAFFLDSRPARTRLAIGSVLLGTAIPSYAIDGGYAIGIAAAAVVLWFVAGDRSRSSSGAVCLSGALLFGAPEFPIALGLPLPFPILPIAQLAGIALVLFGAGTLRATEAGKESSCLRIAGMVAIADVFLAVLFHDAYGFPTPMRLTVSALAGLAILFVRSWSGRETFPYVVLVGFALLMGPAIKGLHDAAAQFLQSATVRLMLLYMFWKVATYWSPYFLTFPAAMPFAIAYNRWSKPIALLVLLSVLIYPARVLDPNQPDWAWHYQDHSLAEHLAFNLKVAALGQWSGARDTRWSLGRDGFDLVELLEAEIRAGRITLDTNLVHIARSAAANDFFQIVGFTGINEEPIELQHDPNYIFNTGSRIRPFRELNSALAAHPAYILDERSLPAGVVPDGYEEIFDRPDLHLFRRLDLGRPVASAP
jgi:hypothetical protein